ncbi:MAG: UbiD family decarboxylase [Chloroflexi bacterium]|nr:UbiD family decarboxylase [Chloroflexota bacterium]
MASNNKNANLKNLRTTLDFLEKEGELLRIKGEVDPIYEISGIQMALESGPALLFENIKGYPHARDVGNIFARRDRIAKMFGIDDHRKFKFQNIEAMNNPIKPKVVERAPCQEVVITENLDVPGYLPVLKHTVKDGGRIIGGGNMFISGKYFKGGTHVSFNRTHFQAKDWASMQAFVGTHLGDSFFVHRGERVPMTINIGNPPAVTYVAGGTVMHTLLPRGTDKLGIAGAIQGFPVEIVKCKTVDAYAIAEAEWVIEGYMDTTQRVWESSEANKVEAYGSAPFFPEWPGYMGRAMKTFKFQATAITHRKDRPIFFSPLAHSYEGDILCAMLREACLYELADRLIPDLVKDVYILDGVGPRAHVIFQVEKRRPADDGYPKNIITAAFGATQGLYLVVAVDEDVDIYSADDVMWAIITRLDPATGLLRGTVGGRGSPMMPLERVGKSGKLAGDFYYPGGMGLDCTVPFSEKWGFERGRYPVDRVDLKKWLTDEQIAAVRAIQPDFAKLMSKRGG